MGITELQVLEARLLLAQSCQGGEVMGITELQVLEARLILAQSCQEYYCDKTDCDFMSEKEESERRLKDAKEYLSEYLVEFNKTDLERLEERLEERVEDAWVAVMAAYHAWSRAKKELKDYLKEKDND